MEREECEALYVVAPAEQRTASRILVAAVLLLIIVGTLGAAFGGPALSDHEAIVAQCARNMRLSGDWVVPEYLGMPWFRKPPLPYWLIAAVSYVLPNEPSTGLPVSNMAARLPTAVSALASVLLLWHLAASMFGRRVGMITAVITGSSLMFLLYGANATPEMLLTMCCTWAIMHFWHAVTTQSSRSRFLHAMTFYVALGVGMLAKGPAPIAVTGFPLAVWWYTNGSLQLLAREGLGAWRDAVVLFFRDLVPRTIQAFTKLHLVPGLIVFAAIFVPWMLEVADRHPHAWNLWNWQYWQRAQGNYEDTRVRGLLYYPPLVVGLVVPWLFLIPEALAAPWMKRYANQRSGLLFGGLLAVMGVGAMSLMQFKKPYYILPAVPGLFLPMAVVADRFFARTPRNGPLTLTLRVGSRHWNLNVPDERRFAWAVWGLLTITSVAAVIATGIWMRGQYPGLAVQGTVMAAGVAIIILFAGITFIRGHGCTALGMLAITSVLAFHITWYGCTSAIDTVDEVDKVAALAQGLDAAGAPPDAKVLWANRRPDARLSFYHNRQSTYLVTPEEIVGRMVDRTNQKQVLQELVLHRADALLGSAEPVYLILDRRYYDHLSMFISHKGRLVATAGSEFEKQGKHWVVVSNANTPSLGS